MRTSQFSGRAPVPGLAKAAAEAPPGEPPRVSGDRPPGRAVIASSSAGSSFPASPFTFTVHSVFRSALNLRTPADPHLISLVSDTRYAHPRSAVVPGARFDAWSLERGVPGFSDGNCLSFAVAEAPRLQLCQGRSDGGERAPAIGYSPGTVRALARAASLVAAARAARGSRPMLAGTEPAGTELEPHGDTFGARIRAAAAEMAMAFAAGSIVGALSAAEKLVGLGTGLTPSGDDFICGFLAARRSLASDPDTRFLDEWGQSFIGSAGDGDRALSRTNEISAAFLSSAAEGRFSSALVGLVRAVASASSGYPAADEDALAAAIEALGAIGHGSGLDAAEGFLFGLQRGVAGHHGDKT